MVYPQQSATPKVSVLAVTSQLYQSAIVMQASKNTESQPCVNSALMHCLQTSNRMCQPRISSSMLHTTRYIGLSSGVILSTPTVYPVSSVAGVHLSIIMQDMIDH